MSFTNISKSAARTAAVFTMLALVASIVPVMTASAADTVPAACTVTLVSQDGDNNAVATYVHPTEWTSISGATWIWSDALVVDTAVEQTEVFTNKFNWSGPVLDANIKIAADNGYVVTLNGSPVGSGDKEVTNFDAPVDSYDIASLIVPGINTFQFTVTNDNAPASTTPQDNPAGFIYKMVANGSSTTCNELPPVDKCSNIDGMQASEPGGYRAVGTSCYPITITEGTVEKVNCMFKDANLLTNGSFEADVVDANTFSAGFYEVFSSIVGWSSTGGFELWNNMFGGPNVGGGAQNAELDVNSPTTISQVVPTVIGNQYKVTLDFSPRSGGNAADNKVEVAVGGVLGSVSADGTAYPANVWTTHNFLFTATTTSSLLELRDLGTSNGLGTLIDNVKVCLVTDNTPDGTITGFKFNDANADGVFTNDESKLANWDIVLTDSDGNEKYATTNSAGEYTFGVKSGSYTVTETQQKGWEQTATIVSTGSTVVGNACNITVTKDSGEIEVSEEGGFEGSFGPQTYTCDFGNHEIDEEEPRRSGGGGGTRVGDRNPRTPTGEVLGASTSTPTGVVLGDATTTMPVGAPNTGAGGTAPLTVSLPTLVAILSTTTRKSK